jgi:hypothetical protein
MTALTRRLFQENHFTRWDIFDGDVRVGTLTQICGTGSKMLWQWACGFYPGCVKPSQQSAGNCDTFDAAKAAFQQAWERLQPQITSAMRDEWLEHQAFTAWKYEMHDAGCRMPTQDTTGQSRCFCGAEITTAGLADHIWTKHMGGRTTAADA